MKKVRGGAVKDNVIYCRGKDSGNDLNIPSEWPLVLMVTFGWRQGRTLGHEESKRRKKMSSY
jgi:hypothetical protein